MILFNPLYPPNPNQDQIELSLIVNISASVSLNKAGGLKERACQAVLPTPTAEDLGHLLSSTSSQHHLAWMSPVLRLLSRCVMQSTVSAWPAVRGQRTAQPCQWPTSNARCYGNATGWADSTSTLHWTAWEGFGFCSSPSLLLFLTHLQFLWCFFCELLSWFGSFGLRLIQYFCSRSRLSWGQITGCYNCFRLPVCVVRTGDGPSVLQGPSCHLYPVAILLVTSHLLVLWLILSLVLLVDQWHSDVQNCFIFSLNTSSL